MGHKATCSEVHAFANEMFIDCTSAEVIKISYVCLVDFLRSLLTFH